MLAEPNKDDIWVRSACDYCLTFCGVLVHRVNGTAVKIEGDPLNPTNHGVICAKGNAALFGLYSKKRVTVPLRRTNPEKGAGVDPRFVEMSWDEALDIVAERLKNIRSDDPQKLYFTTFDMPGLDLYAAWCLGFGTAARPFSSGFYCGNNIHNITGMTQMSIDAQPDPKYCKYLLLVGTQIGAAIAHNAMQQATGVSRKRPGGVKVVCVDPVGGYSAAKAEEWIPTRPGTDAAFLLAVANLLVNEYRMFDSNYLKLHTNAPYLISKEGTYVRGGMDRKPLIWDAADEKSKPFDDPTVKDFALEGTYTVDGRECSPAFQRLKDHVKKYTPEYASEVTTIPSATIRRIAREFGEAASIGSTIEIDGKVLPYRPAACAWYRGLSAHKHSMLNGMAAITLDLLIGAIDVPGGLVGDGQLPAMQTEDGLLSIVPGIYHTQAAYPPRKVVPPTTPDLFDLLPVGCYSRPFFVLGMLKPEVYKTPYTIDMLMQIRTNFLKTSIPQSHMEKVMKAIPFVVSFSVELDETAEFADIVFPDLHYLERIGFGYDFYQLVVRGGHEPRQWYGQKPVVSPSFKSPWGDGLISIGQVLLELARRAGFLDDVYRALNHVWKLSEGYKLEAGREYKFTDLIDRYLKTLHGSQRGLGWYMQDGLIIQERSPEEMYPGAFIKGRVHLYDEFMIHAGTEVEQVTRNLDIPWDTSDYQPIADWKPCPAYSDDKLSPEYDLYLVNYKVPQQSFTNTIKSNPVLQQLTERQRNNDIRINTETAVRKGVKDGDPIWIENTSGAKVKGRARVTELIHPEVVACQGNSGRFSKAVREGGEDGGVHFNDMVIFDEKHIDYVSAAVDSCIRVKIYNAD